MRVVTEPGPERSPRRERLAGCRFSPDRFGTLKPGRAGFPDASLAAESEDAHLLI